MPRPSIVAAGLAWIIAVGALPARADDDIDLDAFDARDDVTALQAAAIAAAVNQDWETAATKARAALALDTSVGTAQARLVLARALEALGDAEGARREIEVYLALPLLERDRSRGMEVRERLSGLERRPLPSRPGPGIGLLAGGAAPTVVGLWLVGTDLNYAARGIESGTWAAIGAPILITGLAMEVIGAVVLANGARGKRARSAVRVGASIAPAPDGLSLGVWGQF